MALDRKQLVKPEKKLRKLLKNLSAQPTPDEVHDLRANTRKVEALVKALQVDSRSGCPTLRDFRRVGTTNS